MGIKPFSTGSGNLKINSREYALRVFYSCENGISTLWEIVVG